MAAAVCKKKAMTIAIAACAIAALTCVMGWFAGRYLPGIPETIGPSDGPDFLPATRLADGSSYESVDIEAGESAELSGIVVSREAIGTDAAILGRYYQFLGSDPWQVLKGDESWEAVIPDFAFRIADAKVVSRQTIEEWYPHLFEVPGAALEYDDHRMKFAVIEFDLSNRSDEDFNMFVPWLWGDDLVHDGDGPMLGMGVNMYILEELYGEATESVNTKQYELEEGWGTVASGETRRFTLLYPLYRSMFETDEEFEHVDASQLFVQIPDCASKTIYRFHLG